MGFLIDTNVLSELRRQSRCQPSVSTWFASTSPDDLYVSVIVAGEIRRGIELLRRRDPVAARQLEDWLSRLQAALGTRLLPVTSEITDCWGRLGIPDAVPVADGLIAATALVHDLTLVTRNTRDVARTGVRLFDPFA
ncbi:type II toxin-antitoxin system VapC family toxin [Plasticicumulans sp.]|uniref:type II toxin-antitoxin system VapC family toxin n=1 Tax=Plasticicumulans sp. TaxID=2307179 RepID=UPI00394E378F|nr:type II toxin-antitoxin system VapC family toxin [Pseudomonadota bacterium]